MTGEALGGEAAMMLLRPGEPPITNATTTKRQRRIARQPSDDASGAHDANAGLKKPNKIDTVLALLNREGGAALSELVEATGWLPHSTRAALTGLKK